MPLGGSCEFPERKITNPMRQFAVFKANISIMIEYDDKQMETANTLGETDAKLPREKLESDGLASLSDTVLIKLMLGICNDNARNLTLINEVSRALSQNESLDRIFADLKAVRGIKTAKASGIIAGFELFRRKHMTKNRIKSPSDCHRILEAYEEETQEHFIMIALNAANEATSVNVISIGLANQTLIHPREVFSKAIEARAISIIIAHNHPTGDVHPSKADIDTTKTLQKAGRIIGIKVIDHIIFGRGNYYSFAEHNTVDFN